MAKIYKRIVTDPATDKRKEGRVWWVSYTQNEEQVKRSLGVADRKTAEMLKAEIERNIERGKAGMPQSFVDVHELFEEFKHAVISKKSPNYGKRMFQYLKPFLLFLQKNELMNIARVTVTDVENHMNARFRVLTNKTWNDELRLINQFFKFAVERDYLGRNPVEKIPLRRAPRPSIEIFTPDELELIFRYAHQNSVAFYKILLYTGLRDGEARHLHWQDVILTPGREHIRVRSTKVHLTKNRRERVVPLCKEAVDILQELHAHRDKANPFVFTGRKGGHRGHNRNTWVACLKRIEKATGIKIEKGQHLTGLHMFRHTFATNALASGVDMRTVQDWLGHASIVQTQRYTNLLPSQKQEQIRKLVIPINTPQDEHSDDNR